MRLGGELRKLQKQSRRAIILCHKNADPDALCASYALEYLLRRLKPRYSVAITLPEGLSKVSKQVLQEVPVKLQELPPAEKIDTIYVVDTSTSQQLGKARGFLEKFHGSKILIDHHYPHKETSKLVTLRIIDKSTSACEVVYDLFKNHKIKVPRLVARALFIGIAYETRHFAIAKSSTFRNASELLDSGVDAQKAIQLLQVPMSESERVARLKASQRLEYQNVKPWIIATSALSSYQASAARALISLGADTAIVAGTKGDEVRVSLRATPAFYEQTRIHLGKDIAEPAGSALKGMGGGHSLAAGINAHGQADEAIAKCCQIITEKLKGQPQKT